MKGSAPLGSFFRGEGGQRQGMNPSGQFLGQQGVNHAVTVHPTFAGEGLGDDGDLEVAFPVGIVPGMAHMAVRVVVDVQLDRLQTVFELFPHDRGNTHRETFPSEILGPFPNGTGGTRRQGGRISTVDALPWARPALIMSGL
ncbi:hypothetical protein MCP1_180059 [Candidatus Terasakiella magnetica]|nr:hypothetical protein MCP1_180059 [Candidatus Terasakiella magnetica]